MLWAVCHFLAPPLPSCPLLIHGKSWPYQHTSRFSVELKHRAVPKLAEALGHRQATRDHSQASTVALSVHSFSAGESPACSRVFGTLRSALATHKAESQPSLLLTVSDLKLSATFFHIFVLLGVVLLFKINPKPLSANRVVTCFMEKIHLDEPC